MKTVRVGSRVSSVQGLLKYWEDGRALELSVVSAVEGVFVKRGFTVVPLPDCT